MKKKSLLIVSIALITTVSFLFEACKKDDDNFAPTASFTVTPNSGSIETLFVFNASASTDQEDSVDMLQVRWDFDGDGNWDSDWLATKITQVTYSAGGTYSALLEVKDTQGSTGQSSQDVTVSDGGGGVTGTITDPRDDQTYTTIELGNQTWFSENLNYPASGSWCYDDDPVNCETYGRLYNWQLAKNVCPAGWHLPSDNEWKQLEMYLGMSQSEADDIDWRGTDEGKKMKTTAGWANDGNGNNLSGFSGLPGGSRNPYGNYYSKGGEGVWWSATEFSNEAAVGRMLSYEEDGVYRFDSFFKTVGASVRCVKD
ncbi:MAG: PKD domain-containing protein [Bacteroidales bacterium]|nr:PKD domain-containing protein [Bacteroidales bacterium]